MVSLPTQANQCQSQRGGGISDVTTCPLVSRQTNARVVLFSSITIEGIAERLPISGPLPRLGCCTSEPTQRFPYVVPSHQLQPLPARGSSTLSDSSLGTATAQQITCSDLGLQGRSQGTTSCYFPHAHLGRSPSSLAMDHVPVITACNGREVQGSITVQTCDAHNGNACELWELDISVAFWGPEFQRLAMSHMFPSALMHRN